MTVGTGAVGFQGVPIGCPHTRPERLHGLEGTRAFRTALGLDLDIRSPKDLRRRYSHLKRAWRRGNPVARYSLDTYSALLRAADAEELEFRERYIGQASFAIPRWASLHAPETYAGWDFDFEKHGGTIFVGFMSNQEAEIAALRKEAGLIAPGRIEPFPVPPMHSLVELDRLEEEAVEFFTGTSDKSIRRLVVSIGMSVLDNRVQLRSSHVAKLEALLDEQFGSSAPIEAVFEYPAKPQPSRD